MPLPCSSHSARRAASRLCWIRCPRLVVGDPLRLRQLVTILTDNAIHHSPAGRTVMVWVRPEANGALLQVDDQGSGVKPENLPRLFDRFWPADDAPAGGTGLGLAIAKWIVEQHGGTIGAFNRPEGGASFWVRLPKTAPATAADTAREPADPARNWSADSEESAGEPRPAAATPVPGRRIVSRVRALFRR